LSVLDQAKIGFKPDRKKVIPAVVLAQDIMSNYLERKRRQGSLALSLLVTRICTDNVKDATSFNDFTIITAFFY
jgi:hypothetical protein